MANDNFYTVVKGDCLSVIAQRYNIDVSELQQLNSEEIQNIDLIFAGQTLKLPGQGKNTLPEEYTQSKLALGERVDLIAPPEECAGEKTTCGGVNIDYVDILYVPAHPQTGKKIWYALTQEALDKVKEEQALMASAITEDNAQTRQNLNNLGLLSKFSTKPHEAFLEETNKEKYQSLILFHTALMMDDGRDKVDDAFISNTAESLGFHYQEKIAQYVESNLNYVSKVDWPLSEEEREQWNKALTPRLRLQAKESILIQLLAFLKRESKALQKIAEKKASTIKTDDNTHFVYDTKGEYFTSERQQNIAKAIKKWIGSRATLDIDEKHLINQSHGRAKGDINRFWNEHKDFYVENSPGTRPLSKLNNFGFVVKEQCLPLALLEGTEEAHYMPKGLKSGWREEGWFSLADEFDYEQVSALYAGVGGDKLDPKASEQAKIQSLLTQKSQYSVQWAYYPTKALLALIDRTLKKDLSALKGLLGEHGVTMPDYFKKILWVKKVALARIEFLKQQAEKAANTVTGLDFFSPKHTGLASYTLLWDEEQWRTKAKHLGEFVNKAGVADVQPVECFLLSEEGKVSYLRGPWWYMPLSNTDDYGKEAKKHLKVITTKVPAPNSNGAQGGAMTFDGLMKEVKKNSEATLGMSIAKVMSNQEGALWQDQYHYESDQGQDGNSGIIYNAQAQFFRFCAQNTASIGVPFDKVSDLGNLSVDKTLSAKVETKMELNILSAQCSFERWFPLAQSNGALAKATDPQKAKVTGYPLVFDYVTSANEDRQYYAGDMCIKVSASVYGMAGATLQVGAGIEFGQSADTSGIGVKGASYDYADYNQSKAFKKGGVGKVKYVSGAMPALEGAGQAGVNAKLFAGIEAGGSVKGEVFWRPPSTHKVSSQDNTSPSEQMKANTNALASLGSISGQVSASFGLAGEAAFKLVYDSGYLMLITAAKWACGPGVGGKIAISLNPYNIDAFIGSLLNLLNSSGFKYVRFLGNKKGDEKGEGETFERLNQGLTVAVSLGLTYADAMLLPFEVLADYKKTVTGKEYAPVIAGHIIKKDEEAQKVSLQTKVWVENLPPETLAPLLDCLLTEHDDTVADKWNKWNSPWSDDEVKETKTGANNKVQLQAILQVLEWIKPATSASDQEQQNKCSQFEKTLYRMGRNSGAHGVNYQDKWQHFIDNWHKLAEFVEKHDKPDESGIKYGVIDFNNAMKILCQNMRAFSYQKLSHDRGDGTAYRTNQAEHLIYYDGPLPDNVAERTAMQAEIAMVKQGITQHQATTYALQIK
ncbi:LysM domain-containing protein [uncultured Shewanella sp.]|uniref:LysM peptidoglycan-binding domain-containing protein n=1 Tax=uncultured Shewanella sp. TaxID=173975 RepID=UPI002623E3F5|nr:LysM domain-containing protein [uncultured Shewanella sp.]